MNNQCGLVENCWPAMSSFYMCIDLKYGFNLEAISQSPNSDDMYNAIHNVLVKKMLTVEELK